MSETPHSRHTFHYNAHGHAVSAQFERPFEHILEVQAGASLPITGGHGISRAEGFNFKEIVSFDRAYTHVSGNKSKQREGAYSTMVTSTVEGLNVLDVVTADRVVSRVSSHHMPGEPEPHIVPVGSQFHNLRIAGCPTHIKLDCHPFVGDDKEHLDTFSGFKKKFDEDEKFRGLVSERFFWGSREAKVKKGIPLHILERYNFAGDVLWAESRHGALLCTLVEKVETDCPGVKIYGNVVEIPQFGRVFLGEYLVERSQRVLTMLRFELGCTVSGTVTTTQALANGHTWP